MKTKKRIPGQSIRNTWQINPRTRVHDNDIRKNKKKQRQLVQKELGDLMKTIPKGVVRKDLMDNPLLLLSMSVISFSLTNAPIPVSRYPSGNTFLQS